MRALNKIYKIMKPKFKTQFILLSLIFLFSCEDYETRVINTIHQDGSITRLVTMKNDKQEFDPEKYLVPVDSTWNIDITMEIENEDTTWVLTAEKLFNSVDELNFAYENDIGSNQDLPRSASFSKQFRWFNTHYRFSEKIDQTLGVDCKLSEFYKDEELSFVYLPNQVQEELKNGPDSLKYMELSDSLETIYEYWLFTGLAREWVEIFYDNFETHPELTISREDMRTKIPLFTEQLIMDELDEEETFRKILGEDFYNSFETEIDSSSNILNDPIETYWNMEEYDIEIKMPGNILASSGYVSTGDSIQEKGILWTVTGDYFLGQPYEMWAESQTTNYWAWGVTGIFIIFVAAGLLYQRRKQ